MRNHYRRLFASLLSFTLILGMLPVYTAAADEGYEHVPLTNEDFESAIMIPGWLISSNNIAISADRSHEGEQSLRLEPRHETVSLSSVSFAVYGNQEYELSAQVYIDSLETGNIEIGLTYKDDSGKELETQMSDISALDKEQWSSASFNNMAPEGAKTAVIQIRSNDSSYTAYIDDVAVMNLKDQKKAVVVNAGFESEAHIPGWSTTGKTVTTASYGDSRRLRLHDYSDKRQVLAKSERIPVSGGEFYTFTTELNVIKQSHSVEMGMRFYDQTGKIQEPYTNNLLKGKAGLGWINGQLEAQAPQNATSVELIFSSGTVSLTDVYIDHVLLSKKLDTKPVEGIHRDVVNPGFEMPVTVEGNIPGWTLAEGDAAGVGIDNSIFKSGLHSLHFKDASDQKGLRVLSDKISVVPGKPYVAKAQVNMIEQTHRLVYEIYYYDSNDKAIGPAKTELFSNLPKKEWSEVRLFSEAPSGAAYARLAFYSGGVSLTEAYLDDVTFDSETEDAPLDRNYEAPVKLGEMVYVGLGQASVIQENALGEVEVYYHSNGKPGTFSVLDGETGALKFSQVIPNTEAVWAMTIGPDQNVYFAGTADGKLYRYLPGERKIQDLGANPSDNWVWDLESSSDGKIYGSTYDHASVFEYDISTGKFRDYGQIVPGQQYARGIAVTDTHIYVGIGTTKHLIKVDRVTGEKQEIWIEGHSSVNDGSMIENIFVVNDKLLISAGSITMLVMDPKTNKIINSFKYSNMISEPSPHDPNVIYFKFQTELFKYDFNKNETVKIEGLPPLPDTVRVKDAEWIKLTSGEKAGRIVLAMVTQYGEYMLYDPIDNWLKFVKLEIAEQSVAIQALETGQDGNLYMGGYQRGMSVYNPFTEQIEVSHSTFAQPEGIGFMNGKAYFGTYVGAVMYSYDHSEPLDINLNPKLEYDIEDQQDRPFAIHSGDNKLFVGTIPDYGVLGGVLAVYDSLTNTWSQYRNVVPNQSIISLAYKDGKLYGGTSVWGGLGMEPTEKEAKIFIWDVAAGKLIESFTPDIPGIDEDPRMIGDLSFGPDGNLWGVVDGTIFVMNPETKQIVKSKMIRPSLYNSTKWRSYYLRWAPDGMLYSTLSRKLFAIDPNTLQFKMLADGLVNNMTVGADGSIYYALENQLFKIAVPQTDATLKSITVDGKVLDNFSPGKTSYTVQATGKPQVGSIPNQPEAKVSIEDMDDKVIITVRAKDQKSVKIYTVQWVEKADKMAFKASFVNDKGEEIHRLLPNQLVTARIEASNLQRDGQQALLIAALYNHQDALVGVSYLSKTIDPGKSETMTAGFKLPADVTGYTMKAFVWEGKSLSDTTMVPLSDVYMIQ